MNAEKQIEEIKNVLIHTCKRVRTREDDIMQDQYAKALYNAGYRKQSEGEWVVSGSDRDRRAECSNCHHEYAVQKGMLQLQRFSYCPNCGAKMKGGAE